MTPILLRSFTKINPYLAVGPPDAFGYHPILTIYQAVDCGDELAALPGGRGVRFSIPGIPATNTVTHAIELMEQEIGPLPAFGWYITKHVPAESGLGAGSGNAAAVLHFYNDRAGRPLSDDQLRELAADIGMDVPYFIRGGRMRGGQYGELVDPLPDIPSTPVVLARPEEGCPTPQMYRSLDAMSRSHAPADLNLIYNDFERVAPCASLELIERMRIYGATGAGLSGSGSASFGFFATSAAAQAAAARLRNDGATWVHVGRTLTAAECDAWQRVAPEDEE